MLKNTTIAKVICFLLTLAIICPIITEVLPRAEALSPYTVVTTVKTTIRKDCYSDSKVLKDVKKGVELTIVSEKTNKYGNLWLGVKGGGWIYSEKCKPVLPAMVTVDYYVKATKNTTVRSSYYSDGTKVVKNVKSGDVLRIVGEQTNKYYNKWLKVSDGGFIFSGNVQRVYDTSTSANFKIKTNVDTTARSKPYSDSSTNSKISKGTVLNVTAIITNCYSNVWYKTDKGYVFSSKASRVVDSVSPASYQVKVTKNTTLRVKPYKDEKDTRSVSKGTILTINGEVVNAYNNRWLRTTDNDFIYVDNTEKYVKTASSSSKNTSTSSKSSSSSGSKSTSSSSKSTSSTSSALSEKPSSSHTHAFVFTNTYEKAHPHYQILKCSFCSETKRGKTSKAKGCDKCHSHKYTSTGKYQSEHPHMLIEKCSCGETRTNSKNTSLSKSCSSCKSFLASSKSYTDVVYQTTSNVSLLSFPEKGSSSVKNLKASSYVHVVGAVSNKGESWSIVNYSGSTAYIPSKQLKAHTKHSFRMNKAGVYICQCGSYKYNNVEIDMDKISFDDNFEPCYMSVKTTNVTTHILPYSASGVAGYPTQNSVVTVIGRCTNSYGNFWYLIAENSGEIAYVYSGNLKAYKTEDEEEPNIAQTILNGTSDVLTVLSLVPVVDTFADLVCVPVDLLRGDFVGAALSAAGAIPFLGEGADASKSVRLADKSIDTLKVASKIDFTKFSKKIHMGKQGKHIVGHANYQKGKSIITISTDSLQALVYKLSGTGKALNQNKERIDFGVKIGKYVDEATGAAYDTTKGIIHYSKDGVHVVPARP